MLKPPHNPDVEPLPSSLNLGFIERLYADYQRDPSSVPPDWQRYFQKLGDGNGQAAPARLGPSFRPARRRSPTAERRLVPRNTLQRPR